MKMLGKDDDPCDEMMPPIPKKKEEK